MEPILRQARRALREGRTREALTLATRAREEGRGRTRTEAAALGVMALVRLVRLDEARALTATLFEEARLGGWIDLQASALRMRVRCLGRGARLAVGLRDLRAALDLAREASDPLLEVDILVDLGELGLRVADPEAGPQLAQALELARASGDPVILSKALRGSGSHLVRQMRLDEAIVAYGRPSSSRAKREMPCSRRALPTAWRGST